MAVKIAEVTVPKVHAKTHLTEVKVASSLTHPNVVSDNFPSSSQHLYRPCTADQFHALCIGVHIRLTFCHQAGQSSCLKIRGCLEEGHPSYCICMNSADVWLTCFA